MNDMFPMMDHNPALAPTVGQAAGGGAIASAGTPHTLVAHRLFVWELTTSLVGARRTQPLLQSLRAGQRSRSSARSCRRRCSATWRTERSSASWTTCHAQTGSRLTCTTLFACGVQGVTSSSSCVSRCTTCVVVLTLVVREAQLSQVA